MWTGTALLRLASGACQLWEWPLPLPHPPPACRRLLAGVDVLLNKESKRETPSVVTFTHKQRMMGTDACKAFA